MEKIREDLPPFARVGLALRAIRDGKLYKYKSAERDYYEAVIEQAIGRRRHEDFTPHPNTKFREERATVVYVVEARGSGLVKIGFATNISHRLQQLRTSSAASLDLLCQIPGGRALEKELHQRFAAHRSHGEWFRFAPEIQAFVAEQRSAV